MEKIIVKTLEENNRKQSRLRTKKVEKWVLGRDDGEVGGGKYGKSSQDFDVAVAISYFSSIKNLTWLKNKYYIFYFYILLNRYVFKIMVQILLDLIIYLSARIPTL